MKPHLPIIILTALLATASAKAGYYAYVDTDAASPAFIPDTVTYDEYEGKFTNKVDSGTKTCGSIVGQTEFTEYALMRQGLFSTTGSSLKLEETGVTAFNGSIIFDNLTVINSDFTTESDGKTDEYWGLPQIVLSHVKFLPGNPATDPPQLASNYCTISDWEATDCTIQLTAGGGSFTSGTVSGSVVIDAVAEGSTIYLAAKPGSANLGDGTLTINAKGKVTIGEEPGIGEDIHTLNGNVVVNYTGGGSQDDWDVEVVGKMNGSLTVNAAAGRVNAGILTGSGDLAAQQVYLTSFTGSTLAIQSASSVMLNGDIQATDTLTVSKLGDTYADITFEGNLSATNVIALEGKTVTGTAIQGGTVSATAIGALSVQGNVTSTGTGQSVHLEGGSISIGGSIIASNGGASLKSTDTDISIAGALNTAESSTLEAEGNISIGGQFNGSLAATAGNSIILQDNASLTQSSLHALVYHDGNLVLKDQSSVVGDVVSSAGTKVTVENSSVSGKVSGSQTLELAGGTIGSAEGISTVISSGESFIGGQGVTVGNLILGGGSLTVGTSESHDNAAIVKELLKVDASTVLNANLVVNNGAVLKFGENAVVTLGCTVTLLGEVSFVIREEGLLMDSVEDVLDADGNSITLSWDQAADMPVWHKELYQVSDEQGLLRLTTDSSAQGATLSTLQLVYDRSMQNNGRLLITTIPEPATATLGLLALAALCARRRREHAEG